MDYYDIIINKNCYKILLLLKYLNIKMPKWLVILISKYITIHELTDYMIQKINYNISWYNGSIKNISVNNKIKILKVITHNFTHNINYTNGKYIGEIFKLFNNDDINYMINNKQSDIANIIEFIITFSKLCKVQIINILNDKNNYGFIKNLILIFGLREKFLDDYFNYMKDWPCPSLDFFNKIINIVIKYGNHKKFYFSERIKIFTIYLETVKKVNINELNKYRNINFVAHYNNDIECKEYNDFFTDNLLNLDNIQIKFSDFV